MKRFALLSQCPTPVVIGIVLWSLQAVIPVHSQTDTQAYIPGEIIVKFKDAAPQAGRQNSIREVQAERLATFPINGAQHWRLRNGVTVEKALEILSRPPFRDAIEYAEPNYVYHRFAFPNDPLRAELWGLHNIGQSGGTADADIDALEAWQVTTGSGDVVVGCIDSGIDHLHEDLQGNIWENAGEKGLDGSGYDKRSNGVDDDGNGYIDDWHGWDFVNNDNDPMDDNNHGTHTAGTIGARGDNGIGIAGVNWNVKLMPLKFLNAGASGSTDNAIRAIQYAAFFGVRITNNSWGGGNKSRALESAIRNAGALFVAAAGNGGSSTKMYPAAYDLDNVVSVAATDHNDDLATFSNWGTTWVDLAAPGVNILSTVRNDGYQYFNGTSMAAPHVAGVAALLLGQHPGWSNAEIKSQILNTVDPLPSLSGKVLTGGRLNAMTAVGGQPFPADGAAPDAVTTLSSGTVTESSIQLNWTATGDDGSTGTAYAYDIRYLAGTAVSDANWSSATQVAGEPLPNISGSPETYTVANLAGSTTYYFAMKVYDEAGNVSALSNSMSATTLQAVWNTETADNSGSVAFYKSLVFGESGYQAIGYSDDANDDVKLARWNGSTWTRETVDAGTDVTPGIDLAFDPSGIPTMSYGWGKLRFAKKNGASWSITVLETKNANNDQTSLAYSPAGDATISYRLTAPPAGSSGLKLARQNHTTGAWTKEIVDPQAGARYNSLAFDPAGRPAIAYSDDVNGDNMLETLKLAHWNGSAWDIQVVETGTNGFGVWASLAYNPVTGYPAIVHGNAGQVRYLAWNGTGWDLEIADCCGYMTGYSLAFDASGTPFVCYAKSGPMLQFTKRAAPNSWVSETVDRSIAAFRYIMKFKPSGIPAIAYRDPANGLKYAERTSAPFAPKGGVLLFSKSGSGTPPTEEDRVEAARIAALQNMNAPDAPLIRQMGPAPNAPLLQATATHLLRIEGNHPNPFNPSTTITYSIPEDGVVSLRVYDMLGREVVVLENGWKYAGKHSVEFNGFDLASGMYLTRLETGGQMRTSTMMLLK